MPSLHPFFFVTGPGPQNDALPSNETVARRWPNRRRRFNLLRILNHSKPSLERRVDVNHDSAFSSCIRGLKFELPQCRAPFEFSNYFLARSHTKNSNSCRFSYRVWTKHWGVNIGTSQIGANTQGRPPKERVVVKSCPFMAVHRSHPSTDLISDFTIYLKNHSPQNKTNTFQWKHANDQFELENLKVPKQKLSMPAEEQQNKADLRVLEVTRFSHQESQGIFLENNKDCESDISKNNQTLVYCFVIGAQEKKRSSLPPPSMFRKNLVVTST